jgi:hypothetical protein
VSINAGEFVQTCLSWWDQVFGSPSKGQCARNSAAGVQLRCQAAYSASGRPVEYSQTAPDCRIFLRLRLHCALLIGSRQVAKANGIGGFEDRLRKQRAALGVGLQSIFRLRNLPARRTPRQPS